MKIIKRKKKKRKRLMKKMTRRNSMRKLYKKVPPKETKHLMPKKRKHQVLKKRKIRIIARKMNDFINISLININLIINNKFAEYKQKSNFNQISSLDFLKRFWMTLLNKDSRQILITFLKYPVEISLSKIKISPELNVRFFGSNSIK